MTVNQVGQNAWVPGVQHDTFIPDQLLSGPLQVVSDTVTILMGSTATYKRGTVLGVITASGKYTLSVATANDGSQVPKAFSLMMQMRQPQMFLLAFILWAKSIRTVSRLTRAGRWPR
jgi:hypothetical protein